MGICQIGLICLGSIPFDLSSFPSISPTTVLSSFGQVVSTIPFPFTLLSQHDVLWSGSSFVGRDS